MTNHCSNSYRLTEKQFGEHIKILLPNKVFSGISLIDGPIAAGKSTLCDNIICKLSKLNMNVLVIGNDKSPLSDYTKALGGGYVVIIYEESTKNRFLPLFYQDRKKYAYIMQKYMHKQREEKWKIATILCNAGNRVIMDRSIFSDEVFYYTNEEYMTDDQKNLYWENRNKFLKECILPDIIVYLKCDADTCVERTAIRSLNCEKSIPKNYHQLVIDKYESQWMKNMKKLGCDLVELDWSNFGIGIIDNNAAIFMIVCGSLSCSKNVRMNDVEQSCRFTDGIV